MFICFVWNENNIEKCIIKIEGDLGLEYQFVLDKMHPVLIDDALESTIPVIYDMSMEGMIEEIPLFMYDKGSTVIRMIQHLLGEEKFIRGLRKYLKAK